MSRPEAEENVKAQGALAVMDQKYREVYDFQRQTFLTLMHHGKVTAAKAVMSQGNFTPICGSFRFDMTRALQMLYKMYVPCGPGE